MTTIRNEEYTTKTGSTYNVKKEWTATVISDTKVNGSIVNPKWRKDVRLITVMFDNNRMATYLSEETASIQIGQVITTHNSINADGYTFISLRDIV